MNTRRIHPLALFCLGSPSPLPGRRHEPDSLGGFSEDHGHAFQRGRHAPDRRLARGQSGAPFEGLMFVRTLFPRRKADAVRVRESQYISM